MKSRFGRWPGRESGGDRGRGWQLAEDLLADPKERAEHVMLVDLARNDVGRVARFGSVELSDVMVVERYSHVMHITSNVRGPSRRPFGAGCPAGGTSRRDRFGSPKVRAMEIIDELEPTVGALMRGRLDSRFHRQMDTCIALRTVVMLDQTAHVQAGGGIVADSVPETEFQETLNKARGLLARSTWPRRNSPVAGLLGQHVDELRNGWRCGSLPRNDFSDDSISQIIDGEIPADIVYEDDRCLAFRDVSPQAPVHVLVIPRKPIVSLAKLEDEDEALMGHLMVVARRVALDRGPGKRFSDRHQQRRRWGTERRSPARACPGRTRTGVAAGLKPHPNSNTHETQTVNSLTDRHPEEFKMPIRRFAAATLGPVCCRLPVAGSDEQPGAIGRGDDDRLPGLPGDARREAGQAVPFAFGDKERLNWHFIPRPRKGLPVKDLGGAPLRAALGLLRSGLSEAGYDQTLNVMSLEEVLYLRERVAIARPS
ncbi:MAG: hypothetical protein Ct9H300mP1_19970 [Planctomycetaceae bacterium]|nr:MAG: hypothetical protein Ct9H300mP1_19970 [Planctomycetaceae bacterium]